MQESKTISVNRWGNGLGIRLPKEFIDRSGITAASKLAVRAEGDMLMLVGVKEPRRHIPLAERLRDWQGTPYELTAEDDTWLNMQPVGEEI